MILVKTYSCNFRNDNFKVIFSKTEMSTKVLLKVDISPFSDSLK